MIIIVGGTKGGCGKSTIATNLSVYLQMQGRDILLMDTDTSLNAAGWCSLREKNETVKNIPVVEKTGDIRETVNSLKSKYEDIIIDVGGRDSPEFRSGGLVADILIFPIRASQFDIWSSADIQDQYNEYMMYNPKLKIYVLFNCVSTNPQIKEHLEILSQMREIFSKYENVTILPHVINERIAYRKPILSGLSIFEYLPTDEKAITEMELVFKTILQN